MPVSISMSRFTSETLVRFSSLEMGRFWRSCTLWMFFSTLSGGSARSALRKPSSISSGVSAQPHHAGVDPVTQSALWRLPLEAIHHRLHRIALVSLNLESEFHG